MTLNSKPVLGHALARQMIDKAIAEALRQGLSVSVAVVDEGGYPYCIERMDKAGLLTWKVSMAKARTAALLRAPSRILADRVKTEPALLRLTDYLPMAGGLPIKSDSHCIGAIGVSGGTPEEDEMIAAAGLEAQTPSP
jgi:glc operon protein GlcG